MLKRNTSWNLKVLGAVIAIIQVFDIFIHVATNQFELLRVSSNVIILVWLTTVFVSSSLNVKFLKTAIGSIVAYLALNIIFLAFEGVTNAEQGGELRVTLFVLVFLTVTLSTLLTYLFRKDISS